MVGQHTALHLLTNSIVAPRVDQHVAVRAERIPRLACLACLALHSCPGGFDGAAPAAFTKATRRMGNNLPLVQGTLYRHWTLRVRPYMPGYVMLSDPITLHNFCIIFSPKPTFLL